MEKRVPVDDFQKYLESLVEDLDRHAVYDNCDVEADAQLYLLAKIRKAYNEFIERSSNEE